MPEDQPFGKEPLWRSAAVVLERAVAPNPVLSSVPDSAASPGGELHRILPQALAVLDLRPMLTQLARSWTKGGANTPISRSAKGG
jgi:hypothetical protein